jgi:hypothetical protein
MRGSHSTRFKLAHGRPSDATEGDFPSKQRVEWVGSASVLITSRKAGKPRNVHRVCPVLFSFVVKALPKHMSAGRTRILDHIRSVLNVAARSSYI